MSDRTSTSHALGTYAPPTITRVYIDPVRELLLATACLHSINDPGVCQTNPCGVGGGKP